MLPRSSPVPPPSLPLTGRGDELAMLHGWLAEGATVCAIHGAPGVGKSALARALAAETERRVLFVDASSLSSASDLATAISECLGSSRADASTLALALDARAPCVLILDGVDRAIEPARTLVAALAAEERGLGPECAVVVTSRARLDSAVGEVLELGPLRLPRDVTDADAPALTLFSRRMQQLRGSWDPEPDELAVGIEVLSALDGLPLAIELAAARAALVGTFALARSLRGAGAPAGLAAVLDGAWEALDEDLRRALAALSVFRGRFDAEGAAAVLGTPLDATLDALHRLRHASLLSASESASGPRGDLRFRLLGPIRELAWSRLEARGEAEPAIARHGAHVAAAVSGAGADHLDALDDVTAVVDRALERRDPALLGHALGAALAVERRRWAATPWLRDRLPLLLAAVEGKVAAVAVADAELAMARIEVQVGPLADAEARCGRARDVFERSGDDAGLARAERTRALVESQLGRLDEAERAAEAAVAAASRSGDRALEGLALHTAARIALRAGDHERAFRGYEDALDRHRRAGDRRWEALALSELAIAHLDRGETDAAEARVEAGAAVDASDPLVDTIFLGARGNIAHERGQLAAAIEAYEQASERAERHGNPRYGGLCRGYRGIALLELGRAAAAQVALEDAAASMRAVGDDGHDRLFGAFALVARARQGPTPDALAERLTSPPGADAWLVGAMRVLARGMGVSDDGAPAADESGLDARLAARVAGHRPPDAVTEPDLVLGDTWFSTPARGTVDTRRRAAMRRILDALVEAHAETPGEPLDADQLIAAGWPGERILPKAATNRLHVTLHRLRDLGLRDGLVFAEEGWLLDPAIAISRAAPA